MKLTPTLLAVGLAFAAAAIAAPAHADDDRFQIRVGAMNVDADGTFSGAGDIDGTPVDFSQDYDFGGKEIAPWAEATMRLSHRNRLIANYFEYSKDKQFTLGEDISAGGTTYPAGSFAKIDNDFQVASLVYDFAVVEQDTFSWGVQVGAEYVKLESKLNAESGTESYRDSQSEDGFAPVLGTRLAFTPNEHWRFEVKGQYLDADWGDFGDYEGDITRANAIAEYRFTHGFGVFAGYDYFRIDVKKLNDGDNLRIEQNFKGPVAGVSFVF